MEWLVHPGWVPKPCPPRQDALCTPARRLLQDSQDVPVTVTPLRAERTLLFDDILVLLQVGGADQGLGVGPGSGWGEGKGEAGGSKGSSPSSGIHGEGPARAGGAVLRLQKPVLVAETGQDWGAGPGLGRRSPGGGDR